MARKASFFARLRKRFARLPSYNQADASGVINTDQRDTFLDGTAQGLGVVADQLDQLSDHDRFLATAGGQMLDLYAQDRDTERGYQQSDLALRITLLDWRDYIAQRGTYRGDYREALNRLTTMPQFRIPFTSLAIKTGMTTPLGIRTCAHKGLGCRIVFWAPDGITDESCAALWAKLMPLHIHYSSHRMTTTGETPECAIVQESGDFAGAITGLEPVNKSLVAKATTASYVSPLLSLTIDPAALEDYHWYVDWRAYEDVDLSRLTVLLNWYIDTTPQGWEAVTLGQEVTPPSGATGFKYQFTWDVGDTDETQTVGTVVAGVSQYAGTVDFPTLPRMCVLNCGSEHFYDYDGSGVLTSNLGGTGTLNYVTGSVVLNFGTPSAGGSVTALLFPPFCFETFTARAVRWSVH